VIHLNNEGQKNKVMIRQDEHRAAASIWFVEFRNEGCLQPMGFEGSEFFGALVKSERSSRDVVNASLK
jgi:hypothetical protein